jgi:hypothetical protein
LRGKSEDEWKKYPYQRLPKNFDSVYDPDGNLKEYTLGGLRDTFDRENYVCEKGFFIWLNGFIKHHEN